MRIRRREQLANLDDLENERNVFRQNLSEYTANIERHLFIEQIEQWGQKSIEKSKQAVEEAKQLLMRYTDEHMIKLEAKLTKLTEELKRTRQKEDFNEINSAIPLVYQSIDKTISMLSILIIIEYRNSISNQIRNLNC